jgi:hypothetical protein
VNSHELRVGDVLQGRDGISRIVLRIEQEFRSGFPVVNLTIERNHSFAVGPDVVLVHNTGGCTPSPKPVLESAKLQGSGPKRLTNNPGFKKLFCGG